MQTSDFDFHLPPERIALRPARPRDASRLLEVPPSGPFRDWVFRDLPRLLRAGDLLVRNSTFVIPAALDGVRPARDVRGEDVAISVNLAASVDARRWRAFARPGKRLAVGDTVLFGPSLSAQVEEKLPTGEVLLAFSAEGAALDAAIAQVGAPPLPPYIAERREADDEDVVDYQTVYADEATTLRSVAAPTAGLHFTPAVFDALDAAGVRVMDISLAVGAGTFLPVKAETPDQHVMHEEVFTVGRDVAAAVAETRAKGGRVIAVGTTALRALEACDVDATGQLVETRRATTLFIRPGYRFAHVDGLITNFHLPRSTLFMLVCAFSGTERMRAAYAHAIASSYRFYSYGDTSLLWRDGTAS